MWYCLAFLLGFMLSGVCFCGNLLLQNLCIRKKIYWLQGMCMGLVSLIPAIIIGFFFSTHPFHFVSLLNWKWWILAILTVLLTSLIIFLKHDSYSDERLFTLCVEAASMEIPQRIMMQTLVCGILTMQQKREICGILITALIWCASFIVQVFVTKNNNWKILLVELVASFVFSIGIGYVYYVSQCLVIPMLAHATERVVTRKILPKR